MNRSMMEMYQLMRKVSLRIKALVNMLENIFFVLHDNASNVCGLTLKCLIAVDDIVFCGNYI